MGRIVKMEEPGRKKLRIVIADQDRNYAAPLHILLTEELSGAAEVEAITDADYYEQYFSRDREIDILVVSQQLFERNRQGREIYVLKEDPDIQAACPEGQSAGITCVYRYLSPDALLREIVRSSLTGIQFACAASLSCKMILVYSPKGGTGKTTLSLAMALRLQEQHGKVLFLEAEHLQTFQYYLKSREYLDGNIPGTDRNGETQDLYQEIKSQIRQEGFFYIPAFRACLSSLGINYSIYEEMAFQARQSGEYDYVVIDTDSVFDAYKSRLFCAADTVVIVSHQDSASLFAVRRLAENIRDFDTDKYLIVCNDLYPGKENAFASVQKTQLPHTPEYIEHIEDMDQMRLFDYVKIPGVDRISRLVS